jgi:hypothetical protein
MKLEKHQKVGERFTRRVRPSQEKKTEQLRDLCFQYETAQINMEQFLRRVAAVLQ